MRGKKGSGICLLAVLFSFAACSKRQVATSVPGMVNPADSSYTDLNAGQQLRIVVPLLKTGGYQAATEAGETQGMTITLSARDLIGYRTSYYAVEGRRGGTVRLRFGSAEVTEDGRTSAESQPPALPFPLPANSQYLRLLFLIRSSRSDHNMAIIGANDRRSLIALTERLKANPDACRVSRTVFCAWVPAGIAVRPQEPGER